MGLLALALGTLLNLPVTGTYHTDISQCVDNLTDDDFMEESAWLYMIWFYGRMDEVTVPSQSTRKQLIDRGLDPDKIRPLPRWVDMETFSPSKRDAGIWKRYGLSDDVKFLYAGRVSKEKIWNGWPRHLQPPCAEAPARV